MRIASRVNGLHPGGTTVPSRKKIPSVFNFFFFFFFLCVCFE